MYDNVHPSVGVSVSLSSAAAWCLCPVKAFGTLGNPSPLYDGVTLTHVAVEFFKLVHKAGACSKQMLDHGRAQKRKASSGSAQASHEVSDSSDDDE